MTAPSGSTRTKSASLTTAPIARALTVAVALAPAVVLLAGAIDRRWMDDDGFINLRVVRNWLHGDGPVFNLDERVEAVTSPLWLAVIAALGAVGLRLDVVAVFAGVALSVTGLLFAQSGAARLYATPGAKLRERVTEVSLPLGAAIFAVIPADWDYSSSGLETGLALAWLGASFDAMARRENGPPISRSTFRAHAVLFGLAPLIRPELGLYCIVPLVLLTRGGWREARERGARPIRTLGTVLGLLGFAVVVPAAYQVFRMGYYAAVAPNTAVAKEAFLPNLTQGRCYFRNFFGTYWLGFPLIGGAVFWVRRLLAAASWRSWPRFACVLSFPAAAAAHITYVVAIGGDYMHARMFIPALFAGLLPIAMVPVEVPADRVERFATAAAALLIALWLPTCATRLRAPVENVCDIGDERGWYARVAKVSHPVLIDDYRAHIFYDGSIKAQKRIAEMCPDLQNEDGTTRDPACRYLYLEPDEAAKLAPACSTCALDPGVDARIRDVFTFGAIGIAGYLLPPSVHLVDRHGLADPLVARAEIQQRGRPGHEKTLPPAWTVARFAKPAVEEDASVVAARHALSCGDLASLRRAVAAPLTVSLFLDNLARAVHYSALRVPRDPFEAEAKFCGTPLPRSATAGGSGGTPFRWRCPAGRAVTALRGTVKPTENTLASIQAVCGPVVGPSFGEVLASTFASNCEPGSTTVGVHGRSDSLVRSVGLECLYQGQRVQMPASGRDTGSRFALACPEGLTVTGINGHAGALVDSLGIECASP